MYDPTVGRFLTEDPSGLGPDPNDYRYVRNSPTNATDPSGLVITFDNEESAKEFEDELSGLGAKFTSRYSFTPKDNEFDLPTVYVVIDPRDMDAVFKYADKNFDMSGVKRSRCKDKLTPGQEDTNERRNNFLIAAGIGGISGDAVDSDGNPTGYFKDAVGAAVKNHRGGRDTDVVVDFGGEGGKEFGTPGAINVNIQPKNTGD
jgi:uncharacterized protein RhaS with RHS repeats